MSFLTVADVRAAVADIASKARDDEVAHSLEDVLWHDVLAAIRDGRAESPQVMAALALETQDIDFARWCA